MKPKRLKTLGLKIKKARKHRSQHDVSAAIGISRSYFGMVEQGRKNIPAILLEDIAQELGKPMDYFSTK